MQNEINNDLNTINNMEENNQISINIQEVENTPVSPISEVIVDSPNDKNLTEPVNTPSGKASKNNKNSTILLILLFLFLFAFVMGMPYINTFIDKLKNGGRLSPIEKEAIEEEKRQEQANNKNNQHASETEKLSELTCNLTNSGNPNYELTIIQKFNYNKNNQVITSSSISKYNFSNIDDNYQVLINKCNSDINYLDHEGYTISCSYSDNIIEMGNTFELETFKPIIDGTTSIEANATYKQDINTKKNELIEQGYTCN